jgi:peroxiredoxin
MLRIHPYGTTLCLALIMSSSTVHGGKFNRVLSIGDAAPGWSDLRGVDGKRHALADLKEATAVVLVFSANRCPVAQAYEARAQRLAADYAPRKVAWVTLSVSQHPADRYEKMMARVHERKWPVPYLHDPSQAIGRAYGVTNTPQVFLLDRDRKIVYMGTIDDRWQKAEEVETHYLRDALDAVLTGKPVPVKETRAVGCEVEYVNPE